jgi:hypothetical protein
MYVCSLKVSSVSTHSGNQFMHTGKLVKSESHMPTDVCEDIDSIHLPEDKVQWRSVVKMVMILQFP